jgi:hypothetical protein
MYNEADTRAKLIDPRLHADGWDEKRIKRDHPLIKADYLLHDNPALPLAVVEAKEEACDAAVGLQQAKRYAQRFGLLFAYSTNGKRIVEFDVTTQMQQDLAAFPSPEKLYKRYLDYLAANPQPDMEGTAHPDAQPYYGPWSDWVYKRRFDDIADLAWKKAWFFEDRTKNKELPLENRLKDKATARALRDLAGAAKKRDAEATLEGLRRWAHLIDHQAHWEAGYRV